ncbi:hypothetical protein EI546_06280 [Aequorivita sp. H23M31]|uniref:Alpha/beta hydrolase n=1 Tax=Aequorivita ciconiae TaxID=2494375 RepID=A0A410G238_9FLAO|nr:hypothetical protein [Aequorivita sp. H23M31]QAA81357.1 hypothetical protein EI546_06280 [Aequorivita sp. H23M31]
MKREELEKTKNGNFVDFSGHKNLLVSFGGIYQGLGIPVFEFFNSISDIQCDKIFLRDFNQAWYHMGVDSELNSMDEITEYLGKMITEKGYEKVCFIGNSMGGYAALLFGSILKVSCVIAFAPQTFINKGNRLFYLDRRWRKQIARVYAFNNKKTENFDIKKILSRNQDFGTRLNIYYSTQHRLDKIHAERLKRINNIFLHPIREGGHEVVRIVRNNGELKSLIKASFEI